jgi:hypothetical protein
MAQDEEHRPVPRLSSIPPLENVRGWWTDIEA